MTTQTNALTSLFSAKKLSHTELVDNALEAFTKAEAQMGEAISKIDADITAEQQAIVEANARIAAAGASKDRLARVLDRVKALTA